MFLVNTHGLLQIKNGITITNTFQKILETNCKLSKIWGDNGSEFYNRSINSWLEKNAIEMYSTHNEGKSVVAERSIRTLKNKIYKYMSSISQNAYIDKLDDIVNKNNNTYQSYIYIYIYDGKPSNYIDFIIEDTKEVHLRTSKYKNAFAKDDVPNWIFLWKRIAKNNLKRV